MVTRAILVLASLGLLACSKAASSSTAVGPEDETRRARGDVRNSVEEDAAEPAETEPVEAEPVEAEPETFVQTQPPPEVGAPSTPRRSLVEALEAGAKVRLRLPWGTRLYRSASRRSTAFTLGTPDRSWSEPIVIVRAAVGKNSDWLEVQTPEHCIIPAVDEFGCDHRIPALDFYELTLYVPAHIGRWYEVPARERPGVLGAATPYPEQADQVHGDRRGPHQWLVEQGMEVYWSNGKRAGTVNAPHVFNAKGTPLEARGRTLTCFEILIGLSSNATRLCFIRGKVRKIAVEDADSLLDSIGGEDIDWSVDMKKYGVDE